MTSGTRKPSPPASDATAVGSGAALPSSYGGEGWRPRLGTHAEEMAAGGIWGPCAVGSEWGRLRAVMLRFPGEELRAVASPQALLMLEAVDLDRLQAQARQVADFYASRGVAVTWVEALSPPPPNLIFQRDLFFMTPQGAIVARMAGAARAGEEKFTARALAAAAVPILATVRGDGVFEGADALWLDPRTVVVGVGFRTNASGRDQVARVLAEQDVEVVSVALPPDTQHLLGAVNRVDADLAVARPECLTDELRAVFERRGVELLIAPPSRPGHRNRGVNFVTLGPRSVVMPAGFDATRALLQGRGVACAELEVSEYLKAAGGPGCFTGILWREAG